MNDSRLKRIGKTEKELIKRMNYKLEYHEGYYAAGNGIPYDEAWSNARKEGYCDGIASLYGNDE